MDKFFEYFWAFTIGGLLCVAAQLLIDKTKLTPARILVVYVCAGVVATAAGLYEPLVKLAGGGATTPLTGFGYTIAEGVKKGVDERGLIGALSGGMTAASAGISAALFFSLLAALVFRSKPKK